MSTLGSVHKYSGGGVGEYVGGLNFFYPLKRGGPKNLNHKKGGVAQKNHANAESFRGLRPLDPRISNTVQSIIIGKVCLIGRSWEPGWEWRKCVFCWSQRRIANANAIAQRVCLRIRVRFLRHSHIKALTSLSTPDETKHSHLCTSYIPWASTVFSQWPLYFQKSLEFTFLCCSLPSVEF